MAGADQRPRERRAPERGVVVEGQLLDLGVDRETELAQLRHDTVEPLAALGALVGEQRLERLVRGIDAVAEDVQLALVQAVVTRDDAVDLDRGNELEAKVRRVAVACAELAVGSERVVVGDGEQPDACLAGGGEQLGGLQDCRPIGSCACGGRRRRAPAG